MKIKTLLATLLCFALLISSMVITGASTADGTTYNMVDLGGKYKTQGRAPLVDGLVMLDWSAAGIEWTADCSGDVSVTVNATRIRTTGDLGGLYFSVYVDGVMQAEDLRIPEDNSQDSWRSNSTNYPFHITKTGESQFTIATNLEAGKHTFAIYNQTEANMGAFGVKAITLNGTFLTPPADKEMFIEVVGDSISASHGILATQAVDSTKRDNAPLYEDATRAWPFLVAQKLNADWSVIAQSGITAIDGIGWGGANDVNMQDVYPYERYYSDKTTLHDFENGRKPDVIVLGLGTNDCWTWNGTGGVTLTEAQKLDGFKTMLTHLRDRNPDAKIIWIHSMMTTAADSYIQQAVSDMGGSAKGYYTLALPTNIKGGHGHPDLPSQTTYANLVSEKITAISDDVIEKPENTLWQTPTEMPDYEGDGNAKSPFMITNGTELFWAVTNPNKNVYFKLANDIILNEMSVNLSTGDVTATSSYELKQWDVPLDQYFNGVLDGDNHVIKGIYIDVTAPDGGSTWNKSVALISHTSSAVIKNLGIENSCIKVSGGATAAGFIGSIGNTNGNNATIENSYLGSDVYIIGDQAGGMIGSGNGVTLKGGITNCYSLATIKVHSGSYVGAVYGGVWSCTNNTVTNFYTTSSKLWGNNPSKTVNVITGASAKGDAAINANYGILGDAFVRIGNHFPVLKSFTDLPDNIPWNGFGDSSYKVEGMGDSAENPYVIETAAQLAHVIWNNGDGKYYKLANNIYLNDVTEGWLDREDNLVWLQPTVEQKYGVKNTTFTGHIEGNGFTVEGIYMPKDNPAVMAALIPAFGGGSVMHLGLRNSQIIGYNKTGGFVACISGASDVKVFDSLFADDTVHVEFTGTAVSVTGGAGGIIGYIYGGSATNYTKISNCYSLATLIAGRVPAERQNGIVGIAWDAYYTVENCYCVGYKPYNATYSNIVSKINNAYNNVYTDSTVAPSMGPYTRLTLANMTGKGALANMPGLSDAYWYAVDGKTPFLRSYGTAIGDANEDGIFERLSDALALRLGLVNKTNVGNGDYNKDGKVNILDLVALNIK